MPQASIFIHMAELDDSNLWRKIKKGDLDAFNILYEQYADQLYSFGMVYHKDSAFVKDCIHDLFLEIHKYRHKLADTDNIRLYLMKSLKRRLFKSRKNIISLSFNDSAIQQNNHKEKSVEDSIIESETVRGLQNMVKRSLSKLSDRQQEVLFLKFNSELSYEEIAIILEISVESTRTLVYRSIKSLREIISSEKNSI